MNKYTLLVGALILAGLLAFIYIQFGPGLPSLSGNLSGQEAAEKALAYINQTLLQGQAEASIAGEILEEKGLYKFDIALGSDSFTSYITKDGTLFFPEGIEIKEPSTTTAEGLEPNGGQTAAAPGSCEEVAKQEAPLLEAFVVSYCPYGLQMQRILAEVVKTMPQLAQYIKIEYMGEVVNGQVQAMHGEQEAQENLRQICLREEQTEKFYPYLSCFMQEGKTDECLTTAGVNQSELSACMTKPERGVDYASQDFVMQALYGVSGSPTLIVNGQQASEFTFGGRTAQAVKELLCCAFSQEPGLCSQELTTEQAATAFSLQYAGAGSGGSCD